MSKYYTLTRILRADATYNIVIGQRSNGKTYAVLKHMKNPCAYFLRFPTSRDERPTILGGSASDAGGRVSVP